MNVQTGLSARRAAFAGALAVTFFLPVTGHTQPDAAPVDPSLVDTIVITADPFARTADQLVQPTEILAGEALERRRGANLGETLEQSLGVSSSDFGRGAGRPVIRGQAGPRVLVLENGISSMDASDVSADHDVSIDPAHAEQIEILKGPATLIYGSSASAGVVNVVSQRLPTQVTPGLQARLRGGLGDNADETRAAGSLAYGGGGTQVRIDGAYLDADDYDIDGNSATDGSGSDGRLLNSALEKTSGSVAVGQFGSRGSLAANLSRYESTYGLPIEEEAFIDLEQDRLDLEGRLLQPFEGVDSIRLRYGRGDYEHTEFEAPGEPGTVFMNKQDEARLELVHAPLAGFRGVIGVQHRDRDFQAIGDEAFVPSTDSRGLGVFLIEERATGFGRIEFGLRSDRDEVEPQDATLGLPSREFTPLSVSAGALFELTRHHHLKLYATHAERSPVAEELFSFGPHLATGSFERGNDGFDTETASNLELSLDRHGGPLDWRVNLYFQQVSDYIFQQEVDVGVNADGSGSASSDGVADRVDEEGQFDPDGELLLLDYRAEDARFWGSEAEVAYAWQAGGSEWRGRLFGDLARGRVDDGGNLPRITPARLGLGLHTHRRPWSLSLDLTRVLDQDRIASLETETDGYTLLGADADYTFDTPAGSLRLFVHARNLLDESARRHTSFIKDFAPMPGASVMAGVEWRLL